MSKKLQAVVAAGVSVPEAIQAVLDETVTAFARRNGLRKCFDDPELYDHLYHILPTLPRPTPHWVTTYTPDTGSRYERNGLST